MYPHANRTVGSMKIKNDVVNDKVKEMVNHKSRSKSRKKLPDERTEKIINKKLDR